MKKITQMTTAELREWCAEVDRGKYCKDIFDNLELAVSDNNKQGIEKYCRELSAFIEHCAKPEEKPTLVRYLAEIEYKYLNVTYWENKFPELKEKS